MSRIRTIKPEFPRSESTASLSRDARLLFIQLWTIADDQGRLRAHTALIRGSLYPYDNLEIAAVDEWLDELESAGCIARYKASGATYLVVCHWSKHQKIDRPTPSRLPAPPEGLCSIAFAEPAALERAAPRERPAPRAAAPKAPPASRGTRLPDDWAVSDEEIEYARSKGMAEGVARNEADKFKFYWTSKAGAMAVKVNWRATWQNWVLNAMERSAATNVHKFTPAELRQAGGDMDYAARRRAGRAG